MNEEIEKQIDAFINLPELPTDEELNSLADAWEKCITYNKSYTPLINRARKDFIMGLIIASKRWKKSLIIGDCPICDCALTEMLEDSEEIRCCDGCGAEWEQSTGDITLDPRESK